MKNFERIYPLVDVRVFGYVVLIGFKEKDKAEFTEDFEGFIKYADEQYRKWTGTKKIEPIIKVEEVKIQEYKPKTVQQRTDEIKRIYSMNTRKKKKK